MRLSIMGESEAVDVDLDNLDLGLLTLRESNYGDGLSESNWYYGDIPLGMGEKPTVEELRCQLAGIWMEGLVEMKEKPTNHEIAMVMVEAIPVTATAEQRRVVRTLADLLLSVPDRKAMVYDEVFAMFDDLFDGMNLGISFHRY